VVAIYAFREREREREKRESGGDGSEKRYSLREGTKCTRKVNRQCPLVLLVKVRQKEGKALGSVEK
jgi:hypothetical protein